MLSDEKIKELAHRRAWRYKKSSDPHHSDTYTFNDLTLGDFARAIESAVREELAKQEPGYFALTKDHTWISVTKNTFDNCAESHRMVCYAAPVVPDGYVMVPQSAFDWLMGLGDNFEPDRKGQYWWRSKLRELIAAAQESNAEVNGGRLADRPSEAV